MNNQITPYTLDNFTEALQNFLASPPSGTPQSIINVFSQAIAEVNTLLPPSLFYTVVEQASIAISITNSKAIILYANQEFAKITGGCLSTLIGQTETILSDTSSSPSVHQSLWESLRQQKTWSGVLVNHRHNGTSYLAEITVIPLLTPQQEIAYYLMMQRDITEVQRLTQQVRNQKTLIESMVDCAPVIIVLLDKMGHIISANQKYKKLALELKSEAPISLFLKLFEEQLGYPWRSADIETVPGQVPENDLKWPIPHFTDQEVRFDLPDREYPRWFVCSGSWFFEQSTQQNNLFEHTQHPYFLLVAHEITALKKQQEEVRMNALRALLAEEALSEGMRETLTSAVHQLQGPMNLITAAVNILKRRAKGQQDPLCSTLQETLEKSNQALDNLRQCIPLPENNKETKHPINLNELLRDILGILTQQLLAEGIVVDWKPDWALPSILGSPTPLRGLFKQLLSNAIEAMAAHRGLRELRILTQGAPDTVTVTIEDTGPGIPEHLRFKAFEPFFTTKKASKHTGMGLSTAQEVVNLHAGTIHIDPHYLQGCRIILQFPTIHPRKT